MGIPLWCTKASFLTGQHTLQLWAPCVCQMKAVMRVGVCSHPPKQQSKIKAFHLHCLQCLFLLLLLFLFNGLQRNRNCSTKRSWFPEAHKTKALLDRAHLYSSLPDLVFPTGGVGEPRKSLAEPGETQEAIN